MSTNPFASLATGDDEEQANPFAHLAEAPPPPAAAGLDLGETRPLKPIQVGASSGQARSGTPPKPTAGEAARGILGEAGETIALPKRVVNAALTAPAEIMGIPEADKGGFGSLAAEALFPKGAQSKLWADYLTGTATLRDLEQQAPQVAEYVKSAARPGVQLASDLATDPLTYAAFGKLPAAAQKVATAAFTAMAAEGVAASAEEMGKRLGKEGLSPDAVEATVSTLLQAGVLYMSGSHLARGRGAEGQAGPPPAPELQGPPDPPLPPVWEGASPLEHPAEAPTPYRSPAEVRTDIMRAEGVPDVWQGSEVERRAFTPASVESHYQRARAAEPGLLANWDDVRLLAQEEATTHLEAEVKQGEGTPLSPPEASVLDAREGERRLSDLPVDRERRVTDRRDAHAKLVATETGLPEDSPAVQRIVHAEIDEMTGLLSKPAWERDIATHEGGITVSDMGGTKYINDSFGHAAGDRFIEAQGQSLLEAVDEYNQQNPGANARGYRPHGGGDELAVLAATPEAAAEVHRLAQEKFQDRVVDLELSDGTKVKYTGGVLDFNFGATSESEVARAAYKRIDAELNTLRADLIARGERAPRGTRPLTLREVPGGAEAGGGPPSELVPAGAEGPPGEPAAGGEGPEAHGDVGAPPPQPPAVYSHNHLAYAGGHEYFVKPEGGDLQVYRAPLDAEIDENSGQRGEASWVGEMDADTQKRILAETRADALEADEGPAEGSMRVARASMKSTPSRIGKVAAEVVDQVRAERDSRRAELYGREATAPALEPEAPPPAGGPPAPPGIPPEAGPPPAPGEPAPPGLPKYAVPPGSLNLWQRIDYGEDPLTLLAETAKKYSGLIDESKRGTMTLAQISQLASNLGTTEEAIGRALSRRKGQALNAEQLWAVNEGLKEVTRATWEGARTYFRTPELERTPAMKVDMIAQLARFTATMASVSGAESEAGRALGVLNRVRSAGDVKALQAVVETYGRSAQSAGQNIDRIAELLSMYDVDDVRAQGKFVREVFKPTFYDKLYEFWVNGLFGPPTLVANGLSGVLATAKYPLDLALGATVDSVRHAAAKLVKGDAAAPRSIYFREALAASSQLLGAVDSPAKLMEALGLKTKLTAEDIPYVAWNRGIREATAAFAQSMIHERSVVGESTIASEMQARGGAIEGKLGKVVRAPTIVTRATDQFFQALIHRMSLNAQAMHQALAEGHSTHLDVGERMAQLLDAPDQVVRDKAVAEAAFRTFNSAPGKLAESVLRFKREHPWAGWIIPFVSVPVNVFNYDIAHAPGVSAVSFAKATLDYSQGKVTARQFGESGSRALLGMGVLLGVGQLVSAGGISGAGPKDPAEQAKLRATGWMPYAMRLGNSWYQYRRIEPLGTTLAMTADAIETWQRGEKSPEELPSQALYSLTRNLLDWPMLSGLAGVFKVMFDAERYGKGWALKTAGSLIPNFLAYAQRAGDQERRLPDDFLGTVAQRLPGAGRVMEAIGENPAEFSRTLDIYGRSELLEDTWLERFASPFHRSPVREDAVTPHLLRLKINIGRPSKKLDDWKDPATGEALPQPKGRDAEVLAQARGLARYAMASMVVSHAGFDTAGDAQNREEIQRKLIQKYMEKGITVVNRRAKGLLRAGQALTLQDLAGELVEHGPPALQ